MDSQTIELKILTDYFHVVPTSRFYETLFESAKETGSQLHVEFFNNDETRPSKYTITSKSDGPILLLESCANSKLGQKITVSFEPHVSNDYLKEFEKRVESPSLRIID